MKIRFGQPGNMDDEKEAPFFELYWCGVAGGEEFAKAGPAHRQSVRFKNAHYCIFEQTRRAGEELIKVWCYVPKENADEHFRTMVDLLAAGGEKELVR
jgi:hypothetical protein